ncbi:MAG: hypothetical protein ACOX5F_00265 [Anaerovoracaceae bacterium]|jgi:hypothetical protein
MESQFSKLFRYRERENRSPEENYTKWKSYGLTNEDGWAGMWREVSLKEMLVNDDHISSIQGWYIDALNDVAAFKEKYPRLPWKVKL